MSPLAASPVNLPPLSLESTEACQTEPVQTKNGLTFISDTTQVISYGEVVSIDYTIEVSVLIMDAKILNLPFTQE